MSNENFFSVDNEAHLREKLFLGNHRYESTTVTEKANRIYNFIKRSPCVYVRLKEWWQVIDIEAITREYVVNHGNMGKQGIIEPYEFCRSNPFENNPCPFYIPFEAIEFATSASYIPGFSEVEESLRSLHGPQTPSKNLDRFLFAEDNTRYYLEPDDEKREASFTINSGPEIHVGDDYYEIMDVAVTNPYFLLEGLSWPEAECLMLTGIEVGRIPTTFLDQKDYTMQDIRYMVRT